MANDDQPNKKQRASGILKRSQAISMRRRSQQSGIVKRRKTPQPSAAPPEPPQAAAPPSPPPAPPQAPPAEEAQPSPKAKKHRPGGHTSPEELLKRFVNESSTMGTPPPGPKSKGSVPQAQRANPKRTTGNLFGTGSAWKRVASSGKHKALRRPPTTRLPITSEVPVPRPAQIQQRRAPEPEPELELSPLSEMEDVLDFSLDPSPAPPPVRRKSPPDQSAWLAPDQSSLEREQLFGDLLSLDGNDHQEPQEPFSQDPEQYGMLEFEPSQEDISIPLAGDQPTAENDPYGYDPYAIDPDEHSRIQHDPNALEPNFNELSGRMGDPMDMDSMELGVVDEIDDLDGFDVQDDDNIADFLPSGFDDAPAVSLAEEDPFSSADEDGPFDELPTPLEEPMPLLAGPDEDLGQALDDDPGPMGAYLDPIDLSNSALSIDEVYLGGIDDSQPGNLVHEDAMVSSKEDITEVVWEVLEEILGKRMAEFEEHLLKRLEKRLETSGKTPSISRSVSPSAAPRSSSFQRTPPAEPANNQMAILPSDWGKRTPESRAIASRNQRRRLDFFLELMHRRGAQSLHLHVGANPFIRVKDEIERLRLRSLRPQDWTRIIQPLCPPSQWTQWTLHGDADFIYNCDHGSFHVALMRQHQGGAAVLKRIPDQPRPIKELRLPEHIERLADLDSGLCLFSGPYGSGISSTIAALIESINARHTKRIITLEDPLDFVYKPKQATIHQRVIGLHAASFTQAIEEAIEEAPDVMLIGELTDPQTIEHAIRAARSGVLVLATVRRRGAADALESIVDAFPQDEKARVQHDLADALRVVVCQQLLERLSGGRIPAIEVLINTLDASRLIRSGDTKALDSVMDAGKTLGMIRMDHSLAALVEREEISAEAAGARAIDPMHLLKLLNEQISDDEDAPPQDAEDDF